MATNYHVGEDILVTDDGRQDITVGKAYKVVGVGSVSVTIIDDAGDRHAILFGNVKLASAPYQGAMGAANRAAQRMANPHGLKADELPEEEEEDTYDTRKANASVLSDGLFNKGDVLVYVDGTPTNEPRTVTRCTATCVWFEETYSMPFNPDEFFNPNGDDY